MGKSHQSLHALTVPQWHEAQAFTGTGAPSASDFVDTNGNTDGQKGEVYIDTSAADTYTLSADGAAAAVKVLPLCAPSSAVYFPSGSAIAKDSGDADISSWSYGGVTTFSIITAGHTTSPARTPSIIYEDSGSSIFTSAIECHAMADETWSYSLSFTLPATFTRWRANGIRIISKLVDWVGGTATDAVTLKLEAFDPITGASLANVTRTVTNDGSNPFAEGSYATLQLTRGNLELAEWRACHLLRLKITCTPDAGNAIEALSIRFGRLEIAWGD